MQRYSDAVLNTRGRPIAGATVTVKLADTETLATLYSDKAGTVSLANPVTTDSTGEYAFYAAPGEYDLTIAAGSASETKVDVALAPPPADVVAHLASTSNPHGVTKTQVGLGNVDNTSDSDKPVSVAQQTALALKANLTANTFTGAQTISTGTSASLSASGSISAGTAGGGFLGTTTTIGGGAGAVSSSGQLALASGAANSTIFNQGANGTAFRIGTLNAVNANYVDVYPATAGNGVRIEAAGTDTNIDLKLNAKNTGQVLVNRSLGIGVGTTIALSGAQANHQKGLYVAANFSGTTTAGAKFNHVFVNSDTVQAPVANVTSYLDVYANVAAGATGIRHGLRSTVFVNGLTGDKAASGYGFWSATEFVASSNTNQGGTGLVPSLAFGSLFGSNPNVTLQSGATNFAGIVGAEINVSINSGASSVSKTGLQIVKPTSDVVQGVGDHDAAIKITDQVNTTVGWRNGLLFGSPASQWAFDANATLIKAKLGQNSSAKPSAAKWGIDFNEATFSSGFLRANGFAVDGDGQTRIGTAYLNPTAAGLTIDAAGAIGTAASVAACGSGYDVGGAIAVLYDDYGGVYRVSGESAGAATSVTMLRAPTVKGTPPANPIATTGDGRTTGTGCTLNITWDTTRKALTLNPSGPIALPELAAASVGTPPSGYQFLFLDASDSGKAKRKNSSGALTILA